jgi:hypothetical protein
MLGICLTVGLVISGQAQTQENDVKTRPWAVIAKRHAMAAKVYPTADPAHPFAMLKEPVLHRSQEVQGSSKGSVFVWVEPSGRPAAICDVFLFENGPEHYRLNNEWHSLSASGTSTRVAVCPYTSARVLSDSRRGGGGSYAG